MSPFLSWEDAAVLRKGSRAKTAPSAAQDLRSIARARGGAGGSPGGIPADLGGLWVDGQADWGV